MGIMKKQRYGKIVNISSIAGIPLGRLGEPVVWLDYIKTMP